MTEEIINEEVKEYKLVQVPTDYGLAIQTPKGDTLSEMEAIVLILNQLMELNKKL